jgi:hypothetical protein
MSPKMITYLSVVMALIALRNISEIIRGVFMENRPLTPSELVFKVLTIVIIIMYFENYLKVYSNVG